jgi:hypothetical protein
MEGKKCKKLIVEGFFIVDVSVHGSMLTDGGSL